MPRAPPAGCRRDLLRFAHFNYCESASLRLPSTNRLIVKAHMSAKLAKMTHSSQERPRLTNRRHQVYQELAGLEHVSNAASAWCKQ